MSNPLKRMEQLIPSLPPKDATLALKFLKERNFQGILELVESDIYKAHKNNNASDGKDVDEESWMKLKYELTSYMSYLDLPDNYDDFEEY